MKLEEFRPTAFDQSPAGFFDLEDPRRGWYVVPVGQNRDSGPFQRSNFQAALDLLDGEGESVEVHRFGHWGPGWFEIILVNPLDIVKYQALLSIKEKLAEYPLLDEDTAFAMEYTEKLEYWENCSLEDKIDLCKKARISIFSARKKEMPGDIDQYINIPE